MSEWNKKWIDVGQSKISKAIGYRHRKRLAMKLFEKFELSGNILDVGCGDGTAFTFFDKEKNSFFGLDSSEVAIEIAKKNYPDAQYYLGSITDKNSLPQTKFDIITCFDMLEEIHEDELALANISSLLNTGGKLLITTQHKEKYRTKHDAYAGNVRRYEVKELKEKLIASNFHIIDQITWGFPFYNFYYKNILLKTNPDKQWSDSPKKTKLFLNIFYYFLLLDDIFINNMNGRILVILAQKNSSN